MRKKEEQEKERMMWESRKRVTRKKGEPVITSVPDPEVFGPSGSGSFTFLVNVLSGVK
jgi:hypothetical protein